MGDDTTLPSRGLALRPIGKSQLGPKAVRLRGSKCFPVCPRKRTYLPILQLLPPPALRERRHRGLARRLIAVRRGAIFMMPKVERPQPRRSVPERLHVLAG